MQNPLAAKEKIENEIQNGRIATVDIGVKPSFHTLNLCIILSENFKIKHFEDLHQQMV
jgi:hypothetical protein